MPEHSGRLCQSGKRFWINITFENWPYRGPFCTYLQVLVGGLSRKRNYDKNKMLKYLDYIGERIAWFCTGSNKY